VNACSFAWKSDSRSLTESPPEKRGRPKGSGAEKKTAAAVTSTPTAKPAAQRGPVDLLDRLLDLAEDAGGLGALKKLVDRLAQVGQA
jgi:hypothetical protein